MRYEKLRFEIAFCSRLLRIAPIDRAYNLLKPNGIYISGKYPITQWSSHS